MPKARSRVDKAVHGQRSESNKKKSTHTIDFVLKPLSVPKLGARDPISGENGPGQNDKGVPAKVCDRCLRIPKAFPPLHVGHG